MNETQRLSKWCSDHQKALKDERERKKPTPNERMAENAKDYVSSYDFWCENCQEDFTNEAYKSVHRLFGDAIATYWTEHEKCGNESVRLITHRDHDSFYYQSDKIHAQRGEYAADVLQAGQYGFQKHSGKVFEQFDKDRRA